MLSDRDFVSLHMEFEIAYTNREITPWGGMVLLKKMLDPIGFRAFDIMKIITSDEYTHLWYASKDKIIGCRDCEFRYMCMDNSALKNTGHNKWKRVENCPIQNI
jgi:hypothetical protein